MVISHPHFKVNDTQQNHHWLVSSKGLFICPRILGIRKLQVSCVCPKDTTNCRSYSGFGNSNWQNSGISGRWGVGREGDSNFTASEEQKGRKYHYVPEL